MRREVLAINFFTFDVEEWYQTNYNNIDLKWCRQQTSNLESSVDLLIELCDKYSVKMTCFVLGQVGVENPSVVKKLFRAGHEISSHGYGHQLVYKMTPAEFRKDVQISCNILENITGEKVLGFRAPSYSVNENILTWYYEILEELGLTYSSSIYPVKTFLYGIDDFPVNMHYPEIRGHKYNILEIPAPVVSMMGKKVGLYIRLFPAWYIAHYIKKQNGKGNSVFIYVHPRELDPNQPRLELPLFLSLIHYYGVKGCKHRIENLFKSSHQSFYKMCEATAQDNNHD